MICRVQHNDECEYLQTNTKHKALAVKAFQTTHLPPLHCRHRHPPLAPLCSESWLSLKGRRSLKVTTHTGT